MRKNFLPLITGFILLLTFFSCSVNKAKIDNSLKKYFDENKVDGCFALLNNANGDITVYNMELDTQRFSPVNTFQVVNALIGLQSGAITNDTMLVKWTGIKTDTTLVNGIDMKWSFKANAHPYFQEIARRIGKDTMVRWIDSLGYGNKNISGPIDSFWLNNTLKISPDEQLGLMKRLYFDQLPFRKSAQQMVREAILQEDNTMYKLSYSYAWGKDENGHGISWVTGWIEENKHVYFFVTFIKMPDGNMNTSMGITISKSILKQLGFFQGKK